MDGGKKFIRTLLSLEFQDLYANARNLGCDFQDTLYVTCGKLECVSRDNNIERERDNVKKRVREKRQRTASGRPRGAGAGKAAACLMLRSSWQGPRALTAPKRTKSLCSPFRFPLSPSRSGPFDLYVISSITSLSPYRRFSCPLYPIPRLEQPPCPLALRVAVPSPYYGTPGPLTYPEVRPKTLSMSTQRIIAARICITNCQTFSVNSLQISLPRANTSFITLRGSYDFSWHPGSYGPFWSCHLYLTYLESKKSEKNLEYSPLILL